MVSKEQVEELMLRYFPKCPLCGADKGYEVSGIFKNQVQCRACEAKWWSIDFMKLGERGKKKEEVEIKEIELREPAKDGRGKPLLMKNHPVSFWQNLKEEDYKPIEEEPIEKPKSFLLEMTEQQLQDSIIKSMDEVRNLESGMTVRTLLSLLDHSTTAERTTVCLLKIIAEQNKILIAQNELIHRALSTIFKQNKYLKSRGEDNELENASS